MGRSLASNSGRAKNAPPAAVVAVVAVAALTLAAGCSFLFSEGAPAGHERRAYFDCGESLVPPVADAALSALNGVAAVTAISNRNLKDRGTTIGVTVSEAVILAGSAVYGYLAVRDCKAAKWSRATELAEVGGLPPPYGLPPFGAPPPFWPPPAAPAPPAPPAPAAPAPDDAAPAP
jgi:hypothetical protein